MNNDANDKIVEVYTDGACKGNPGDGGWGVYLRYGETTKELCGGEHDTTNNRMELTAAIRALESLNRPCRVKLFTDSTYVKNGVTEWMKNWKSNGWQTKNRKPVKNQELWQQLDLLSAKHQVEWAWVKAHVGIEGNEKADYLANMGIKQLESGDLTI